MTKIHQLLRTHSPIHFSPLSLNIIVSTPCPLTTVYALLWPPVCVYTLMVVHRHTHCLAHRLYGAVVWAYLVTLHSQPQEPLTAPLGDSAWNKWSFVLIKQRNVSGHTSVCHITEICPFHPVFDEVHRVTHCVYLARQTAWFRKKFLKHFKFLFILISLKVG